MIRFILFVFAAALFISCEDLETNSPALQGNIDEVFFKAIDARATQNENGSITIQGISDSETLTLYLNTPGVGTYALGINSGNYASFENSIGNIYSTVPNGGGQLVVSNLNTAQETISGTFKFNAILPDLDTILVRRGVFFEVPFGVGGVSGGGNTTNAGVFNANIDGVAFNPFTVTAVDTGNSIVVSGATTSTTILVRVPSEVSVGTYNFTDLGFQATFTDGVSTEQAVSGTITIMENNLVENTLRAIFDFETNTTSITAGQLDVLYE